MLRQLTISLATALIVVPLCAPPVAGESGPSPGSLATLAEHGIEPTAESLAEFLESLHPDAQTQQRVDSLIKRLGHPEFFERESAMQKLLQMPVYSPEALQRAAASADAETRWRAAYVLKNSDGRTEQLLAAVYDVIHNGGIAGLADPVLRSLPFCSEPWLRKSAQQALQATAVSSDTELFRKYLPDGHVEVRSAAIAALAALEGEDAVVELQPLVSDELPAIRITVAEALGNLGEREMLPLFVELLEAEEEEVRARSARMLRLLTQQRFGYSAVDSDESRANAVAKWRAWVDGPGATARLHFPVGGRAPLIGRTLICYYAQQQVVELDADEKETWQITVARPWGCEGLPNGHRLISSYQNKLLIEYDARGKQVWTKTQLPGTPFKFQRLDNGNTLVACSDTGRILEIRRDEAGTIVWDVTLGGRPVDVERLENGRTLVALQSESRVVEIDREGKVQWELPNMFSPWAVQRLDGGNTLVCQQSANAVREVDRKGRTVWEVTGLSRPYDCQRLPNGNTLIVDRTGVREVDRNKNIVWQKAGANPSSASRF